MPGERILDLGCGTGRDCYLLSQLVGPRGKVIGVDMTAEQLAVGKSHLDYHKKKFGFGNDNAGKQLSDRPIRRNAPAAYFCTVPVKAMVASMARAGVPAEVSNSAGTFVCNHLIYGVLHHIACMGYATRAGFIHVPFMEAQIIDRPDTAALSLATMITGAKAAIMAAVRNKTDLKLVGGALD